MTYTPFDYTDYRTFIRKGDFWSKRGEELRDFADSAELDRRLELLDWAREAFGRAAEWYERAAAEFGERD